jgi:hypothetical protein
VKPHDHRADEFLEIFLKAKSHTRPNVAAMGYQARSFQDFAALFFEYSEHSQQKSFHESEGILKILTLKCSVFLPANDVIRNVFENIDSATNNLSCAHSDITMPSIPKK